MKLYLSNKELPESVIEKIWIEKGIPCAAVFARGSHRCGYIGLPKRHKWHGKDYDKIPIEVHGGLTFAQKDFIIEGYWWIGFDCAHFGDKVLSISHAESIEHFWTLEEVVKEVKSMIKQVI